MINDAVLAINNEKYYCSLKVNNNYYTINERL